MKHDKFSIAEMFSDSSTGKTSVTKVSGFFLIVAGAVVFSVGMFFIKDIARASMVSTQSLSMIGAGTTLLVAKILKPTKEDLRQ